MDPQRGAVYPAATVIGTATVLGFTLRAQAPASSTASAHSVAIAPATTASSCPIETQGVRRLQARPWPGTSAHDAAAFGRNLPPRAAGRPALPACAIPRFDSNPPTAGRSTVGVGVAWPRLVPSSDPYDRPWKATSRRWQACCPATLWSARPMVAVEHAGDKDPLISNVRAAIRRTWVPTQSYRVLQARDATTARLRDLLNFSRPDRDRHDTLLSRDDTAPCQELRHLRRHRVTVGKPAGRHAKRPGRMPRLRRLHVATADRLRSTRTPPVVRRVEAAAVTQPLTVIRLCALQQLPVSTRHQRTDLRGFGADTGGFVHRHSRFFAPERSLAAVGRLSNLISTVSFAGAASATLLITCRPGSPYPQLPAIGRDASPGLRVLEHRHAGDVPRLPHRTAHRGTPEPVRTTSRR